MFLAGSLLLAAGLLTAQDETDAESEPKSYWADLTDGTIDLFEDDDNPVVQRVRLSGRLHGQLADLKGDDARNRDFEERFEEFRRLRLEVEIDLLDFASLEVGADLVDDERFRPLSNRRTFGYQNLSDAYLSIDLENALDLDWVDDLDLQVGRQKVGVGFERDQSSNEILTVERSSLAEKLGGEVRRPTGALMEVEKSDFTLAFGYFSTTPADELAALEGDGFYYTRLQYEPSKAWTFFADWTRSEANGPGRVKQGYAWATTLNIIYERKRHGFALMMARGNNGDARFSDIRTRRQGEFSGAVVAPWFWLKKDYLQLVAQGQWQQSDQSEGIRVSSRYLRQIDDLPGLDVENGYGDDHRALYVGLNYHPWAGDSRLMFGISRDILETVRQPVESVTQWAAFRAVF
ncbi:MAG: hypothetical protein SynsKO_41060 [Synoicihabitans sp.]